MIMMRSERATRSILKRACLGVLLFALGVAAAEDGGGTRELLSVDKAFDVKARVHGSGAVPSLAERDGRMTLQIAFTPGPNKYPAVYLPTGGKLDLTGYNRIEFQVANTGGESIRIGCRVSDGPVSDGHKHCNTEMASLAPGEAKSITVVFGKSYGGAGWDLEPSKIDCLSLQAEDPKGATTVALQGIVAHAGKTKRKLTLAAGDTWRPAGHCLVPEKGSALDFSFLLDAPAGRHGPVVIRSGRMEYRDQPGRHARFYGANVVYGANFPDKETAQILADQLARNGYNALRLHHFDQLILDKSASDSVTFDAAQLDRIDYLFACLKARGIYISIDLYSTREALPTEIPELGKKVTGTAFKSAVYILDSARQNWEAYTKRLLTHVNPYTKLAWKDDPALFSLALVNEGQVYQTWEANAALYRKRFAEVKPEAQSLGADEKAAAWNWFLTDIQREWIRRGSDFVRQLGCQTLITDANYIPMRPLAIFRTDLDVIDIHGYWDGPAPLSGWGAPLRCNQGNLAKDGGVHMPLCSVAGRLLGKPFMITEFNIGYPNRYRALCGPVVGACSSLNAVDALFRFDHIGAPQKEPGPIIWLSSANDPMALMGDRVATALFLRQEVQPPKTVVPYLVTDAYLNQPKALDWSHWYPDNYLSLGAKYQIGTLVLKKGETLTYPTKVVVSTETVDPDRLNGAQLLKPNELGKLEAMLKTSEAAPTAPQMRFGRSKGTCSITTPLTECLFVSEGVPQLTGDLLQLDAADSAATVSAVSLDGKPLAGSRRVLLMHLTDAANAGDRYRDDTMSLLEQYGKGPVLVRKGSVRITLRGPCGGAKLYALDLSGKRLGEVTAEKSGDAVAFTAQTFRGDASCMAYELVR